MTSTLETLYIQTTYPDLSTQIYRRENATRRVELFYQDGILCVPPQNTINADLHSKEIYIPDKILLSSDQKGYNNLEERELGEIWVDGRIKPLIIKPKYPQFPFHALFIDFTKTQGDFSEEIFEMSQKLIEIGFVMGFNPMGMSNSIHTHHWQGCRLPKSPIWANLTPYGMNDFLIVQDQLRHQAKIFSIAMLGNNSFGVIEHKFPENIELISNNSSENALPYRLKGSYSDLEPKDQQFIRRYLCLAPGAIEAAGDQSFTDKNYLLEERDQMNFREQVRFYSDLFHPI